MRRLYKIIESAAANGFGTSTFTAPPVVLGGSMCDPIVLAKHFKAWLVELGYRVKRTQDAIVISWRTQKVGSSKKKQAPVLQLEGCQQLDICFYHSKLVWFYSQQNVLRRSLVTYTTHAHTHLPHTHFHTNIYWSISRTFML